MREMERIHFSFTYGGECLSLAAAKAAIKKLSRNDIESHIQKMGSKILWRSHFKSANWKINIMGYDTRSQIQFPSDQKKWLFMQLCAKRGILTLGVHNMMYAHSDEDVQKLLSVYDEVFPLLDQMEFTGEPPISNFKIRWF